MDGKHLSDDEMLRRMDAWRYWAKDKEIKPYQKCDYYEKEK
jgi:hypothetical protein